MKKEIALSSGLSFGQAELDLIKQTKCVGATEAEFNLFVYDCQSRGLNPLRNEIHFIKRKVYNKYTKKYDEKASHQVGIDGFRLIAQRTGEYEGQTRFVYGDFIDFLGAKVPEWVEVGIWRKGFREPLISRTYFREFAQTQTDATGKTRLVSMWGKMPTLMIGKVCEAQSLRRAFPDQLEGLYTPDEMAQADNPETLATVEVKTSEVKADSLIDIIRPLATVKEVENAINENKVLITSLPLSEFERFKKFLIEKRTELNNKTNE